jgi:hypothetical protein
MCVVTLLLRSIVVRLESHLFKGIFYFQAEVYVGELSLGLCIYASLKSYEIKGKPSRSSIHHPQFNNPELGRAQCTISYTHSTTP